MKKIKMIVVVCFTALVLTLFTACNTTMLLNRYLDVNAQTLAFSLQSDGTFMLYNVTENNENWSDYGYQEKGDVVLGREWEDRIGDIKKVVVQKNVTSIGAYSFYKAKNLKELYIGPDVTSINTSAFEGCSNLQTINIDPSNTSFEIKDGYLIQISTQEIIRGTNRANITLAPSVRKISRGAFSGLNALKEIDMSQAQLTVVPREAFYNCSSLTTVKLPDGVTLIEDNAFQNCTSLGSIDIGDTDVKNIGHRVFFGCTSLKEVAFPETLVSIGELSFSKTGIEKVTFTKSNNNVNIRSSAFYDCDNLKEVYIGNASLYKNASSYFALGYLVTNKYIGSHGNVVRNLKVYIADDIFSAEEVGAYLGDAENYIRLSEKVEVGGVQYVVYQGK